MSFTARGRYIHSNKPESSVVMKKILIIEDEQFIRENIVEILESSDYKVFSAPNGVIGVELAQQQLPDLILCDVMMPDLDGHGVLEMIRSSPATAALPFIFLTARANPNDLRVGMNLGADDYLTKPFRVPDLLNAVQSRLKKYEQEKIQAETRLEELRNSISLSLPHEFLTPITGILGCSELLLTSYDMLTRDEIMEMLTQLSTSARRLSRLTQNFILYARLISVSLDKENELLRKHLLGEDTTEAAKSVVIDVVSTKIAQDHRDADISITSDHDDVTVRIRHIYLNKIIEEVIDNASKYSHPGSPINVVTVVTRTVFICTISNIGRFMTPEQIASIGAYTQFDRKIYEQQGSGLGLSIAKKLLELHNGELNIQSDEGQTIVAFSIPLA